MNKKLPFGIEDFKRIIDDNYYYVDKSMLIQDVLDGYVSLFTRPRRFGKSLNMSMLYYFFSNKEKDNAYLFEGLEVSKYPEIMKHQNQYPVIFVTLKDMKGMTFEEQMMKFSSLISEVLKKNIDVLETTTEMSDANKLKRYRNIEASKVELEESLFLISQQMEKHYGKKVIVLIDEYDVPLQSAYKYGYYDEMSNFISSLFSKCFKTNTSIERGIMTGCLRIAKESIFTGLNNFAVHSITNPISSSYFGFTQQEVDNMLEHYHLSQFRDLMKEWYDGYLFGGQEIYNPWSTILYTRQLLKTNETEPVSFWANTSSNDVVYDYIKNADDKMREEFETLMQGKTIIKLIEENLTYRDMDNPDNVYSFMLMTGYLKAIREVSHSEYELTIPNREVYEIFNQSFMKYFREYTYNKNTVFLDALKNGDTKTAINILSELLYVSISYFDYDEKFYHGIMLGILSNARIASNQEAGLGRYDIAVLPKSKLQPLVLLELKMSNEEENLENDALKALQQIKEKQYVEGLERKGYKNIMAYGVSFYKKFCWIEKLD